METQNVQVLKTMAATEHWLIPAEEVPPAEGRVSATEWLSCLKLPDKK